MKKLLFILFSLLSLTAYSQISTEFWFAVPSLSTLHESPDSIRFCFATFDQPANVTVSQPAIIDPNDPDYFVPVQLSIPANSYKVMYLKQYYDRNIIEISPSRGVLPFGVLITSDVPVSAYYAQTKNNSEVYTMKGKNALGTEFLVPMQNNYSNSVGRSSIEIVAAEDNTEVFIETLVSTINFGAPGRYTVKLNRGEACAVGTSDVTAASHLQNTKITSTKPIAVNSTDDSVALGGDRDLIGDQLVPTDLAGDSYIAVKNGGNAERLYIYALEANTDIFINNRFEEKINPGDVLTVDLVDKVTLVTSAYDKNFVVFQLTSDGNELGGTMLPKIKCTGSTEIVYRPAFIDVNQNNKPVINILVKTDYTDGFSVNGIKGGQLVAADFTPVPDAPEWSWCSKKLEPANGIIRLRNDSAHFHAGILDIGSGTLTYGYFSDYNTVSIHPQSTQPYYLEGEMVKLSLFDPAAYENIIWTKPNGEEVMQEELIFQASENNAGIYKVNAVNRDGCIIESISDVVVHVFKPESRLETICKGDTVQLEANGQGPYLWILAGDTLSQDKIISVAPEETSVYGMQSAKNGWSIFNGDFLNGSDDFSSDYREAKTLNNAGEFAITSDAGKVNPSFSKIYDHTTGYATFGSHMVVKCGTEEGRKIWSKQVELTRNTQYKLSGWFLTAQKNGAQARLQFTINDEPVGNVIIPPNAAPADPAKGTVKDEWEQFSCTWNSGTRSVAVLSIETAAGMPDGAGVCIDDIEFLPLFQITDTFEVKVDSINKPYIEGEDICRDKAVLKAGTMENDIPYFYYKWYNADGEFIDGKREITVSEAGEYFLEVSNGFCVETASFTVHPVIDKVEVMLNEDIEVCADDGETAVDYTLLDGEIGSYSIYYDEKARMVGFEDCFEVPFDTGLYFSLPQNVTPGIYHAEIQLTSVSNCVVSEKMPLRIMVKYDPGKIFTQKWNDVLTLYNTDHNGGYVFTAFQWYKNGEPLPGENKSYLYLTDSDLDEGDIYSLYLTRDDGVELFTCGYSPEQRDINKPLPTLYSVSQNINLGHVSSPGTASFRNPNGVEYSVQGIDKDNTLIKAPDRKGLYILKIRMGNKSQEYKVIVQ